MSQVVFIRHGQSAWNLENRFSGWADVDLTEQGIREAHEGGQACGPCGTCRKAWTRCGCQW